MTSQTIPTVVFVPAVTAAHIAKGLTERESQAVQTFDAGITRNADIGVAMAAAIGLDQPLNDGTVGNYKTAGLRKLGRMTAAPRGAAKAAAPVQAPSASDVIDRVKAQADDANRAVADAVAKRDRTDTDIVDAVVAAYEADIKAAQDAIDAVRAFPESAIADGRAKAEADILRAVTTRDGVYKAAAETAAAMAADAKKAFGIDVDPATLISLPEAVEVPTLPQADADEADADEAPAAEAPAAEAPAAPKGRAKK